jgi:hypothetical protein
MRRMASTRNPSSARKSTETLARDIGVEQARKQGSETLFIGR